MQPTETKIQKPKQKVLKKHSLRIPIEIMRLLEKVKQQESYSTINQTMIECIKHKYKSIIKS